MARLGDEPAVEYVVLAAGNSRRMGFSKVVTSLAGASPLARLAVTCGDRPLVVVTTPSLFAECRAAAPRATVLQNREPERGMTSSLLVAHAFVRPEATLGILLADKPFVGTETLERSERELVSSPCDVLVATVRGEAGHPVYFGPGARALVALAPSGDSLRTVRDAPSLVRHTIAFDDPGVLEDLDTPGAWHAAERRLLGVHHA